MWPLYWGRNGPLVPACAGVTMCMRADMVFYAWYTTEQPVVWAQGFGAGRGISDKTCFIILHLVIKPANVPSVGCMFKSNASPSFYSLLLPFSFCLSPNRCSHPRSLQSAWLSGQYSQFSSPHASLPSSARCLRLFSERDHWTFPPN